jgi:hypothetical protein
LVGAGQALIDLRAVSVTVVGGRVTVSVSLSVRVVSTTTGTDVVVTVVNLSVMVE